MKDKSKEKIKNIFSYALYTFLGLPYLFNTVLNVYTLTGNLNNNSFDSRINNDLNRRGNRKVELINEIRNYEKFLPLLRKNRYVEYKDSLNLVKQEYLELSKEIDSLDKKF